ncbi:MAG: recombinase family protein, partial [Proteobacteria bacterium]
MTDYIYSRVSTDSQSGDPQTHSLRLKYPKAEIVSEIASGAKSRPMLAALCQQLKKGDCLVVAALDRLGRKTTDVLA